MHYTSRNPRRELIYVDLAANARSLRDLSRLLLSDFGRWTIALTPWLELGVWGLVGYGIYARYWTKAVRGPGRPPGLPL